MEDLAILPRRYRVALATLLGVLPGIAIGWFDLPAALPVSGMALRVVWALVCTLIWAGAFGLVAFVVTQRES